MPCASIAAMCSTLPRRASKPPWMAGCSVLTRPSSISGKPVCVATSVTASPASASSLAVPPVESRSMPSALSSRASSTTPVLSETEISACIASSRGCRGEAPSLDQLVLDELAPQGVAVDAEPFGGTALVAAGFLHHDLEQRPLDDAQDHLVHRRRLDAAQVAEVALQALAHALLAVLLVGAGHASVKERGKGGPAVFIRGQARHDVAEAIEPGADRARLRVARVDRVHLVAKRIAARQALQCPADVLSRGAHAGVFAIKAIVVVEMLEQPAAHVDDARRRRRLTGRQVVCDRCEDPRPPLRGA